MPSPSRIAVIESPVGRLWVEVSDLGLRAIRRGEHPDLAGVPGDGTLAEPLRQLNEYFSGRRRGFDLTLDTRGANAFDAAVWAAARAIPFGETATYGELAALVGSPRAARAVGGALARCVLTPVVPCHRVVHADGSIAWGAESWVKRWYLVHEGAMAPTSSSSRVPRRRPSRALPSPAGPPHEPPAPC